MKKISLLLFASVLVFSCTKDVELADASADLTSTLAQYDDTNMGIYKGVFTTQGTLERGIIEINITPNNLGVATLKLTSGQEISFVADRKIEAGAEVQNLVFSSSSVIASFKLSADLDGTNVQITDVMYKGIASGAIAAHETSRAPVVPITGVLACDDCAAHPLLVTGDTGTLSFIYVGDGSGDDSLTAMVDVGVIFSNGGTQSGCVDGGAQTTCDISGGGTFGSNVVAWDGTHTFNNADDCSEAAGTWSLNSGNHGDFTGTFTSDVTCVPPPPAPAGDTPATAISITLGAEGDGCSVETNTALLATNEHTDSGLATTCYGTGFPDIYYSWTATTDGLTLTALNIASTSVPGVSVMDAATMTEITCGEGSFGAISLSGWAIGDSLLIRVSAVIDIPFCIEEFSIPSIPANDLCGDAEDVLCGATVTGNTVTATNSDAERGNDVWYTLTDTSAGNSVNISLCGSGFDTYLSVYDACSGTLVVSNDDFCGGQSELTFTADGTTAYIIRVDGYNSSNAGAFTMSITCTIPPPPSSCGLGSFGGNGSTGAITDNSCPVDDAFVYNEEIDGVIGVNTILDKVSIDISHTWDSDLQIKLVSPSGTSLDLSIANGGQYDNYTQTVFQDGGGDITAGSAPFTGTFQAQGGTFASAFGGQSIVGDWTLAVCDSAMGDAGILNEYLVCFTPIPEPLVESTVRSTYVRPVSNNADPAVISPPPSWNTVCV